MLRALFGLLQGGKYTLRTKQWHVQKNNYSAHWDNDRIRRRQVLYSLVHFLSLSWYVLQFSDLANRSCRSPQGGRKFCIHLHRSVTLQSKTSTDFSGRNLHDFNIKLSLSGD